MQHSNGLQPTSCLKSLNQFQEKSTPAQTSLGPGPLRHLGEMLQNSPELTIELDGSAIPTYPGALELFEHGVSSTLAPPTGQPGDGWRARFS